MSAGPQAVPDPYAAFGGRATSAAPPSAAAAPSPVAPAAPAAGADPYAAFGGRALKAAAAPAPSGSQRVQPASSFTSDTMAIVNPKGLVAPGNIPIWNRPRVHNADGSYSTEYSTSFQDEHGHEVIVPTVVDGKFLTPDGKKPPEGSQQEKSMFRAAWQHYLKTGQHLGAFDNASDADAYAGALHNRGERPSISMPAHEALTDNPNGEGVYQMGVPGKPAVAVPYSKVQQAGKLGMFFSDRADLARYARDHHADPVTEGTIDHYLNNAPWWDVPSQLVNAASGAGGAALRTLTAHDRAPHSQAEQQLQLAAETPNNGVAAGLGDLGENIGEFFSGQELLGLLGKTASATGEGLGLSERLKGAQQAAQVLEKHPAIAKLVKIGQNAVRNFAIATGQSAAKPGATPGGAVTTGLETAAGGAALEGTLGAGKAAAEGIAQRAASPAEGAAALAETARGAVEPPMRAAAEARGAGIAGPEVASSFTMGAPKVMDVDEALKQVGDYTGARTVLQNHLNAVTDEMDARGGSNLRTLTKAASKAQAAADAAPHDPDKQGAYVEAVNALDEAVDKSGATPELKDALRTGWRRYYRLGDVARAVDSSLSGMPGESAVSGEQRGVNGTVLLKNLRNLALRPAMGGRQGLAEAVGGEDRLKTLEQIGERTKTNAGRLQVAKAVQNVVRYGFIAKGASMGWGVGGPLGGAIGASAGEGAYEASRIAANRVYRSVLSNPQVAKNLIFALDSGARPEHYGPFIAGLIEKMNQPEPGTGSEEEQQP